MPGASSAPDRASCAPRNRRLPSCGRRLRIRLAAVLGGGSSRSRLTLLVGISRVCCDIGSKRDIDRWCGVLSIEIWKYVRRFDDRRRKESKEEATYNHAELVVPYHPSPTPELPHMSSYSLFGIVPETAASFTTPKGSTPSANPFGPLFPNPSPQP